MGFCLHSACADLDPACTKVNMNLSTEFSIRSMEPRWPATGLDFIPAGLLEHRQTEVWTWGRTGENRKRLLPALNNGDKHRDVENHCSEGWLLCCLVPSGNLRPLRTKKPLIIWFWLSKPYPLLQIRKLKIKINEVEIWWVYFEMEMRWLYIHILCVHRRVCINYRKWILIYDCPCSPSDCIYLQMRSMKN